jgi:hypothetical protein
VLLWEWPLPPGCICSAVAALYTVGILQFARDIKTVKDAKSIESYLRQYDKVEGYACLEQDVRAVESRVQAHLTSSPEYVSVSKIVNRLCN